MATTAFAVPPRRRRAVVAGATGLVGRELVGLLLGDRGVGSVVALVRRRSPAMAALSGVTQQVVDFAQLPSLADADDAFCCLGTTIKAAGSQEAFRAVDFDAVLAFARAARAAGATRFGVVSALGADAASRVFYNRVKGELEDALRALPFEALVIARPSLLVGDRATLGQPTRTGEVVGEAIGRLLGPLVPRDYRPIAATRVARSLLDGVRHARGPVVLRSGAMNVASIDSAAGRP